MPSFLICLALLLETNLSKNKSYLIGSTLVTSIKNSTNEPAAEPRPGPVGILLSWQ